MNLNLLGYFRSGTSYRVRIALNYKGQSYTQDPVNLLEARHHDDAYRAHQPQGLVPTLQADGEDLIQSPAILEWIEENWPTPPLLPADPTARAHVRAFAAVIGCDIHPIQNLRIMKHIKATYGLDQDGALEWARHWIHSGFEALEKLAHLHGKEGDFIFGDAPTMAEVYLVPQMYNARRFGVPLDHFPHLVRADAAATAHPAFEKAHPSNQPDAPHEE